MSLVSAHNNGEKGSSRPFGDFMGPEPKAAALLARRK